MATYNGHFSTPITSEGVFGKIQQITISGTVTQGRRNLLLIDETKREIVGSTWSESDGSYSFTINGSTIEKYSVVCLPDRFASDENGAIYSKVTGISV